MISAATAAIIIIIIVRLVIGGVAPRHRRKESHTQAARLIIASAGRPACLVSAQNASRPKAKAAPATETLTRFGQSQLN